MSACKETNDDKKLLPRRFVWCENVVFCYWDKSKMIIWVKMYVKNGWGSYIKLLNYTKVQKQSFQDTVKVSREHLNQGQNDPFLCCLLLSPCHQKRTDTLWFTFKGNTQQCCAFSYFFCSNIKNNFYCKEWSWKSWVTFSNRIVNYQ